MKTAKLITRRRAIVTGLAAVGGLVLTRCPKDLPPTYGNLLRMGDTVTYAAHRALLPRTVAGEGIQPRPTSRRFPPPAPPTPVSPKARSSPSIYRRVAERSVRRLATVGRGVRRDAANVLARRAEAAPVADADHAPHVRGRLDRHRPVDRRAAECWCSMRRASCRPPGS